MRFSPSRLGRGNPAALLMMMFAGVSFAAEPWADERLTVRGGLAVWYDVARQGAAREAAKLPALVPGSAVDSLLDASGRGRHLTQPVAGHRPVFHQSAPHAWVSFDGKDDFLGAAGWDTGFTNLTVFVVTAPRSNAGYFRAFLSFNRAGQNDYTSGFNLDLGGQPTADIPRVSTEGPGFGGERNLLTTALAPRRWATLALTAAPGTNGVRLYVNGQRQGARDRDTKSILRADEFRLGARHYANDGSLPAVGSFFEGEIAEVIVFNRALSSADRGTVEQYLATKHAGLGSGPRTMPLVAVTNPPPVQMLVPGFEVKELPVTLNNVNNLRYRPDGKLLAVGYDGRIWLLSDTNGDGLEDKAAPWWTNSVIRAPVGAALTPPGFARGEGVVVPSVGKISLILDTNRDDRADEEVILASGWPATRVTVDATSCAFAPDGSLYFGLGCADYSNGYLLDKSTGRAAYDIKSERGTIQKISADLKTRETVCTGIRWPIGMAFNRHGDLFVTDQEGATWMPNGNPFDELLHIQPGRFYGFPPAHPKHNPGVIDEPSVFDYGPQHQSNCGLVFNESVNGGPTFGPASWAGDALIAGESRGKIYRTKLAKTAAGYVAQNYLIACLKELTIDVSVSPRGDLLVCTHSGAPDWGTGPTGKGHLYRIRYADTNAPQPVLTWSASPTEIKIAFDKPLATAALKDLAKKVRVEQGRYVMPGDRFETIRPGYQIVRDQLAQPRYAVEVLGTAISQDARTLTLTTKPRETALNCAVTLPDLGRATLSRSRDQSAEVSARQEPRPTGEIELLADAHGLEATWSSAEGRTNASLWLPHADLAVSRAFTAGSAEHEAFFKLLNQTGELRLRGQLDLWEMLQPSIQPGAKLDYERPKETTIMRFSAENTFGLAVKPAGGVVANLGVSELKNGGSELEHSVTSKMNEWWPYGVSLLGDRPVRRFAAAWYTAVDARPRALPLRRFYASWARPESATPATNESRVIPEIAGGNWLHGRRLYFSGKVACAKCHTMRGEGGQVGPDLSNLPQRDYASVMRDIAQPNVALNPDHLSSIVELADGDSLVGLVRETASEIFVTDASAQPRAAPRAQVKSMRPSTLSLMPEGLWDALTKEEQRDLMTFLLTVPLEANPLERDGAPPPRKRAEVEALIGSSTQNSELKTQNSPLHIILCDGPKDHGRGEHDYPLWKKRWSTLLALADNVTVDTAHIWPSAEQFAKANVIAFFNNNPGWNEARGKELDAYLARGGGAAYFHWAVEARGDAEEFAKRIGLASNGPKLKYRHGPIDFALTDHPLARGFTSKSFTKENFIDETYWQWIGNPADVKILATSIEDGVPQPEIWTREVGKGRVFVAIPGHYNWTFDDPVFRVLALRGLCWAAGQPMDRLAELATVGARMAK